MDIELNTIYNYINLPCEYDFISSSFKKPINCDNIKEKLVIKYSDNDTSDINEYLQHTNLKEMDYYHSFQKSILLSDSMNPHVRPYSQEAYYVNTLNKQLLSHISELNSLLKKSINNNSTINLIRYNTTMQGIIHTGEKGSGKTFSQNVWLHSKNLEFEKNNIFWVRLDVAKLIEIWNEENDINSPSLVTIEEYFLCQLVYVFCKHFIKEHGLYSDLFGNIAEKLKVSNLNNIPKSNLKSKNEYNNSTDPYENFLFRAHRDKITTIIDYLYLFEKQIATGEGYNTPGGRLSISERSAFSRNSFMVNNVLIDSQKYSNDKFLGSRNTWINVAKILKKFILQNGYYILYIVDGSDNINYNHSRRKVYTKKILSDLYKFPLNIQNSHDNELVLISCRDTTLEEIQKWINEEHHNDRQSYRNINNFYRIRHRTEGIKNIVLKKRLDYVDGKFNQIDCYMKKVFDTIANNNNIFDESLWDSNIRCFLTNHLTLAKYITFRYYISGEQSKYNITDEIKKFENINFFLNGELYVDESKRPPLSQDGYNFCNIFSYTKKDNKSSLYLIFTRILQIIKQDNGIIEDRILRTTGIFNYCDLDILNCIDQLIFCGMIKSVYADDKKIKYYITSKGKYVLDNFFSDVHYLYYACLDTPLPINFINKIKVSRNNFKESNKRYYPPYCIITGIEFLNFLNNYNKYEMKIVANKIKIKPFSIDVNYFDLPINKNMLLESINAMLEKSLKDPDYKEVLYNHFNIKRT